MKKLLTLGLVVTTALVPAPAFAQSSELEGLREQLATMRAEMERMSARIEQLEATPAPAPVTVAAPAAATPTPTPAPAPAAEIAWRGAPEMTGAGGWNFKPRGRMQFDAGSLSSPAGFNDASTGFATELRRAYLGVEGKIPGGVGYRAEVDLAASAVEITDLYVTYKASDHLTMMVGQTKPFWGLEEVTSDLFTSFNERAGMNTAFGFERRLGVNGVWTSGPVIVQAGLFTDNIADLNNDENNSMSADARVVFSPRVGDSQLHFGGSVHLRDINDSASGVRYRARPFTHTSDLRFVDTGNLAASGEQGYGLEAAWINGPFHATGEYHWQHVDLLSTAPNPTFSGGYAEVGMFLTKGDSRGYRGGVFDRTRPAHALGDGGMGAVQLNLRYDYLDLTDAGISGGTQEGYLASLVWIPTGYTKLMLNYGHVDFSNAAVLAGTNRDYAVDSIAMRAQIDF